MASDPVRPEDVPDELVNIALAEMRRAAVGNSSGFAYASEVAFMRSLLAAVLTEARTLIADFACGERMLTNAEMTEVAAELHPSGDPGKVYLAYVRRMIGAWPGGYGG